MFSKNNKRYFDHNPHIEIITDINYTLKSQIGYPYIGAYKIVSFKFVHSERFVMSHTTRRWFIYDFLPRCHMDNFTFEVCLSTFPPKIYNYIKQYLNNKEGSKCITGQTNN